MARAPRVSSKKRAKRVPLPEPEIGAAPGVDRRSGEERRTRPRDTWDRRTGPKTAAKMARVRIARDVEHLKKSLWRGDWFEVARIAAGVVGEVGAFVRAGVEYPIALIGDELPDSVPEGDDRPVILVHGWFHNRTGMRTIARRLKRAGHARVFAIDLPTATASVETMAAILERKIEVVRGLTGADKVDVVAHSLGGVVARWFVHHRGGASRVAHLVTLGAPHKGTALAAFTPVGAGKALAVGSRVIRDLDRPPPKDVKVTAIWSDMDYLVLPPENTVWHPDEGNIRIRYVGHMSLLYSREVFREVLKALDR